MIDESSLALLRHTRLTDNEGRVYLALLQLGTATVSEIALVAELKRPTVYTILESLVTHGAAVPDVTGKVQRYTAADPAVLATELETVARDFHDMLPFLRAMQRKNAKPHVSYYTGVEGLRRAFLEINRPHEVSYLTSIAKMQRLVPAEVARWQKLYETKKARAGGRHLLTDTPADHNFGNVLTKAGQVVRYLPSDHQLDMDVAVFDNRVVLTALEDDIHVLVVDSPALYRSMKTMFDLAWISGNEKPPHKSRGQNQF